MPINECRKTRTLHGGNVNEHISATSIGLDKSVTLRAVEPFYSPGGHEFSFVSVAALVCARQLTPDLGIGAAKRTNRKTLDRSGRSTIKGG
ncbi:hypothetical protein MPLB_1990075 [Mesorhizobium sp. ORS 3324]|nr:hypothetical protein MPLB_1990075 [Mesorhizobium sp. ORS 3324]